MGGRWSRRRFIGGLAAAGGGALLAACGGTPPTNTPAPLATYTATAAPSTASQVAVGSPSAPPASPARPSAPATPGTPGGTPVAATPSRPGPASPAASPTPPVGASIGRLLALVPQRAPLPGEDGIWLADLARQKANYGFADLTSPEALQRLPGDRQLTFTNVVNALPLPEIAGRQFAAVPAFREATGYDFWQVDRTVQAGSAPQQWARLEGRFNRAAITGALNGADFLPVAYGGEAILARGGDGQIVNPNLPLTGYTLARLNRVVLEEGALAASPYTALAQAGIDARAGRLPSFAADPDYAALVAALGPVVGAIIAPPATYYATPTPSGRPTPTPTPTPVRTATPAADRLPPYTLVGLGLRDDGRDHAMVIALVYVDAADARAAAPVLLRRIASYRLAATGQRLSDRAEPGDAEFVTSAVRTVLVAPLRITDEPSLSLWLRMYVNRDYPFLGE